MAELRIVRDELQYAELLEEAKRIALEDPIPGSSAAQRLEVVSVLLEKYELERFQLENPDPVDAIVYRLAEFGLKQKDLAAIVGSPSRASEIMSRKRDLTLQQIRLLHERLKIPAEILIGSAKSEHLEDSEIDWKKFPINEMKKRGWFDVELFEGKTGENLIRSFFARSPVQGTPVLLRKNLAGVSSEEAKYAISAWVARVLIKARDVKRPDIRYTPGSLTDEFLKQIAKLSRYDDGPKIAIEFLAMKGVIVVVEGHLPKTKLDGAAMLDQDGTPVVGLTMRYGRIDYFWFTLMHELIHVQKHLSRNSAAFIDDEGDTQGADEREMEADIAARDIFIPRHVWLASDASRTGRPESIQKLADSLMIDPAIVAGRYQKEKSKFNVLREFTGRRDLKPLFKASSLESEE
jgi:HTH-type transcriptional regulator / antitoxin HigA